MGQVRIRRERSAAGECAARRISQNSWSQTNKREGIPKALSTFEQNPPLRFTKVNLLYTYHDFSLCLSLHCPVSFLLRKWNSSIFPDSCSTRDGDGKNRLMILKRIIPYSQGGPVLCKPSFLQQAQGARHGQKVCDTLRETGKRTQREEVATEVLFRPAMANSFPMRFLQPFPEHAAVAPSVVVPWLPAPWMLCPWFHQIDQNPWRRADGLQSSGTGRPSAGSWCPGCHRRASHWNPSPATAASGPKNKLA